MRWFLWMAPLLLVACTGLSAEQQLAVSCRGYAATLNTVSVWRKSMSERQEATVQATVDIVIPLCEDAASGRVTDFRRALDIIRPELRALLEIEQERQP